MAVDQCASLISLRHCPCGLSWCWTLCPSPTRAVNLGWLVGALARGDRRVEGAVPGVSDRCRWAPLGVVPPELGYNMDVILYPFSGGPGGRAPLQDGGEHSRSPPPRRQAAATPSLFCCLAQRRHRPTYPPLRPRCEGGSGCRAGAGFSTESVITRFHCHCTSH